MRFDFQSIILCTLLPSAAYMNCCGTFFFISSLACVKLLLKSSFTMILQTRSLHFHSGVICDPYSYLRIVVVEQSKEKLFNRAKLFNIGFVESQKLSKEVECFIFHDVDLLPRHDYNIYACTHNPRHMYSAVDVFRWVAHPLSCLKFCFGS